MRAALSLELIGKPDQFLAGLGVPQRRPWVAKLSDLDGKLNRIFLRPDATDYVDANSAGSRGVMRRYWLHSGSVYEVHQLVSWSKSRRWFAAVTDGGEVQKITFEDVKLCLNMD